MRLQAGGLVVRLVLVVVIAGTVAAAVGTLLLGAAARSATRTETLERNTAIAQQLASRVNGRLATARETLRIIATDAETTRLGERSDASLRAALRVSTAFDELTLFDREGTPVAVASTTSAAGMQDHPSRPDLAEGMVEGAYTNVVADFPPVFEVAVPVENPPGNAVGFLLGRMPLEILALPVLQIDIEGGSSRFLVDASGAVLVHPERDRLLHGERFPVADLDPDDGTASLVLDGEQALASSAPVPTLRSHVVIVQAEAQILRSVARRVIDLAGILLAVLTATMLAVILAGERLLRPLQRLADAVTRLGRGERGVRAGVTGAGEVGALSRAFDRMAARLDRRDAQLEELRRLSLLVNASVDRDGLAEDLVRGAQTLLAAETCVFTAVVGEQRRAVTATVGPTLDDHLLDELTTVPPEGDAGGDGHGRPGSARRDGPGSVPGEPSAVLSVPVATISGAELGVLTAVRPASPFSEEEHRLASAFASFAGVALDNARRLQLEQALVYQLQEGIERRRLLIGGVTHEFRTPLTCIEGFSAELLERWDAYPPDERAALLGKINAHASELDRLVTQLLEFAATERGRTTPALSVLRLREVVEQQIFSLAPLLGARDVHVDVPDVEVHADSRLVRGILDNLLSNAAKYSRSDAPITVRGSVEGEFVQVDVVDRGVGMSARELERAFQPFWRAPGVRSERGTGLGLALAAEYSRAMDGVLTGSSRPGAGSTFSFTLRVRARETH